MMSTGGNLLYAAFFGILALYYRSWWFLSLGAYYAVLGGMRLSVIRLQRQGSRERLPVVMRRCGAAMLFLAAVLSGVVCLEISELHNPIRSRNLMIVIAAWTFTLAILSLRNAVLARRGDPALKMLRNISLAGTAGSILSLQRAMLGTFGNASDLFSFRMELISGAAAFLLVVLLGVRMLRQAGR